MDELETTTTTEETTEETNENAELSKLRAELAKSKAALDKATKEAGDYRKQLRAKQTADEAAAEEAKEAAEARDKELKELRKRFAVAETSKKVMSIVGDEPTATSIAEAMYGADDSDAVIAAFAKAWTAKEKMLKMEYGKIPAPGVGSSDGATLTREQLDSLSYSERIEFANKHPDEYERLMGRK